MTDKTTCPICDRDFSEKKFSPFCSKRCADVDLSRWLKGNYVIPGPSMDVADDTPHRRERSDDEI